jgi:hypothetical protein
MAPATPSESGHVRSATLQLMSSWANLRRKHTGRHEPHGIKYWGLGNESEPVALLPSPSRFC